jgi:hypothetical protein
MPIVEPDDEAFVGIIPRAPNWTQRAIERRGPPPGNAETLIRGGAGWVFGITPREELVQEAIVREKREAPSVGDVSIALAREMAWRWFNGRPPFVSAARSKEQGVTKMARNFVRYAEAEEGFLTQALGLIPKHVSTDFGAGVVAEPSTTATCACIKGTSCCAGTCQSCQEG